MRSTKSCKYNKRNHSREPHEQKQKTSTYMGEATFDFWDLKTEEIAEKTVGVVLIFAQKQ